MSTFKSLALGAALGRGASLRRGLRIAARSLGRKPRTITFYHETGSPHSHLLLQGLIALHQRFPEIAIDIVVVPAPAADVDPDPIARAAFEIRDARELAQALGLSFAGERMPSEDRLRRADAVLLVPRALQEWLSLALAIGEALWSEDGEALQALVHAHGTLGGAQVRPQLEANYAALRSAGHYVGGTLAYLGEFYEGVLRIEHLVAQLTREQKRPPHPLLRAPVITIAPADRAAADDAADFHCFFSFRSPYSYLALARMRREPGLWDRVQLRPLLPMAMRGLPLPKVKTRALVLDAKREADALGIPFGKLHDPLGAGVESCLAVFEGLTRELSARAARDFAWSATTAIWSEGGDMSDPQALLRCAERVGLSVSAEQIARWIASDAWRASAEAARERIVELGFWGVPTFVVGSYATWGQDRLPWVRARLVD